MHEKIKRFYIAEHLFSSKQLRSQSSGGLWVQISKCLPTMYRAQYHINLSQRVREMGHEGEKGKERRSHPLKDKGQCPAALVPRVIGRALALALLGSHVTVHPESVWPKIALTCHFSEGTQRERGQFPHRNCSHHEQTPLLPYLSGLGPVSFTCPLWISGAGQGLHQELSCAVEFRSDG